MPSLQSISQLRQVLVIVAMEVERVALLGDRAVTRRSLGVRIPIVLHELEFARCRVSVARSGVGLVNAGILLAQVIEHRPVDAVILLGVGGALDERLRPGDWVVARQILQHDSMLSDDHGSQPMPAGELVLSRPDGEKIDPVMPCDRVLIEWIRAAFEAAPESSRICEGTILSGSEFVGSRRRKSALRARAPDALLVDMEAAALAQICRRLDIPFVAAKTVADRADPAESIATDYISALRTCSRRAQTLLESMIQSL
jgi:5'-methylthioadenosine/S-adenosylhomocysteine nucleosidase